MSGSPRLSVTAQHMPEYESEYSTSSLPAVSEVGFHKECRFKFSELRQFLNTITCQIDLPAVALILASKEVIELHLAQELLQFTGGIREKGVKVVEIFNQLQRREDRVPFFLWSLLESADNSPTNRELYEKLSDEMDFTDSEVDVACKNEARRHSASFGRRKMPTKMKKTSGSTSSGIESSTSSIRKFSSPQPYMSDIPTHVPVDSMQMENVRLHQEVERLHKMLDWSFSLLTETQQLPKTNSKLHSTIDLKRNMILIQSIVEECLHTSHRLLRGELERLADQQIASSTS